MPGEAITHLVTVSCTGFHAPGFDLDLIERLPLRPDVQRTHVGFMGCHGAINALRVALALARSDPAARVLVCAAELCSLHYQYAWDPELLVGNAVFGNRFDGIQVYPSFTGTIERNNIVSNGACGIGNNPGVSFLMATNNYWGAASGPGPNPADTVCNAPGKSTQLTPYSTRPFVVSAPIDP